MQDCRNLVGKRLRRGWLSGFMPFLIILGVTGVRLHPGGDPDPTTRPGPNPG